jgi:hypothetical protein
VLYFFPNSIGLKPTPVEGLLSLCAISLLKKDKQLSELVIKELKSHEKDETFGHHVSFMMAQFFIKYVSHFRSSRLQSIHNFFSPSTQGSKAEAIQYISSRIHEFPDRAPLRKLLAIVLLETYKDNETLMRAASRMAESTLSLRINSQSVVSSQEAADILALASMAMECFDTHSAKMFAQKAVHIHPQYWKILKIC